MPWYHKSIGEHGKRNTRQITTKWFKEYKLSKLEHDGMKKLQYIENRNKRREERKKKHLNALENKKLDMERKQMDELRRIKSKAHATFNREVCTVRLSRLDKWGRENVERAKEYQAELKRIDDNELERKRKEELLEHSERKRMKYEEHLTLMYLAKTRTLPEQILLRKCGFIEAKPRPLPPMNSNQLEDTAFHVTSGARQNLHVLNIHLIQPEPMELDDSDSDDDITTAVTTNTTSNTNTTSTTNTTNSGYSNDVNDDDDEPAWLDKLPPKELSIEIEKFPQAVEMNCIRLGKEGVQLLSRTIATPPVKNISGFKGFQIPNAPVEILVPNLLHLNLERNNIQRTGMRALVKCFDRGGCPKLKTLNLSSNNIEDSGIICLSNSIIKNDGEILKHLRTLILRLNIINDRGCCSLAHVLLKTYLPSITSIDLKMNSIKYRGAHAMLSYVAASTVKNKKFHSLNLSGNTIDRNKLGRFKSQLPKNCCI